MELKVIIWYTGILYSAVLLTDGPDLIYTNAKTEAKLRRQATELAKEKGYLSVDWETYPDGDTADKRIAELLENGKRS